MASETRQARATTATTQPAWVDGREAMPQEGMVIELRCCGAQACPSAHTGCWRVAATRPTGWVIEQVDSLLGLYEWCGADCHQWRLVAAGSTAGRSEA